MMRFNYYEADIKKSTALGIVTLEYLVEAIRNPKQNIKHIFEEIMKAEIAKDMARKMELKSKLYSFTPCVFLNTGTKRKYSNIVNWTGLMVLDFDHMPTVEYAEEFKQYLFRFYGFVVASWLSASKHGVRAIINIPECKSTEEFKHYFNAIEQKFNSYLGFDKAPKNCILPLFISYDEKILYRTDATQWTIKHIPIEQPTVKQYIIDDKSNVIEKIIFNRLNTITNSGHTVLRATAYLLGGYVGAGYIDYNYSFQMINKMIDSHYYLNQKASVYKKTAKTMIDKGIKQPTYLQPQT